MPISVESKYRLDPKKAMEYVDENTIGVFVMFYLVPSTIYHVVTPFMR